MKKTNFTQVPNRFIYASEISHTAFRVGALLFTHSEGMRYQPYSWFQRRGGFGRSTVSKALKELQSYGIIEKQPRSSVIGSNQYNITDESRWRISYPAKKKAVPAQDRPSPQQGPIVVLGWDTNNTNNKRIDNPSLNIDARGAAPSNLSAVTGEATAEQAIQVLPSLPFETEEERIARFSRDLDAQVRLCLSQPGNTETYESLSMLLAPSFGLGVNQGGQA